MPRGVLLHGPPGTGKTLLAKVAASEAEVPVLYASGSEFVEMYVGIGAKRIRNLFEQARSFEGPCMVFIDEIDAIGYNRVSKVSNSVGGNREAETTLNQLLNEMDGFDGNDQILVVAATNLINNIDPALQRPGRFDRKIEMKLPDPAARKNILSIHLKKKNHNCTDFALGKAATTLNECTGAEIENVVNLVALTSARRQIHEMREEVIITDADLQKGAESFMKEKKSMMNDP